MITNKLKSKYQITFRLIILIFISLWLAETLNSQACSGTQATVSIQNGIKVSADVFTFEVWIQESGSTTLTFSAYGGGVLGIPVGVTGTFIVLQQPSANGLSLNNFNPNYSTTAGFGGTPLMRWTNNPVPAPGVNMPDVAIKVAKFQFTRTGGTALPATLALTWQPDGSANPPQVVTYCNGNTNPVTLTVANGGLVAIGTSTSLPLDLLALNATIDGDANLISWTTANESNCAFHIVEKSQDGTVKWNELGRVKAKNLYKESEYEFADRNPSKLTYYRIRFQDYDGNNSFSNIVSVNREGERNSPFLDIHPNPTNDFIRLDLSFFDKLNGPIEITVYDMNGKQVLNKITTDTGAESIDIRSLPASTYNIKVKQGELIFSEKVIKVD
jgi:hypothetical protein